MNPHDEDCGGGKHLCAERLRIKIKKNKIKSAELFFQQLCSNFILSFYFLQENRFYAEFILLHIHESEKEKKKDFDIFHLSHGCHKT